MIKRFIKPHHFIHIYISRASPIESGCCRLPTTSAFNSKRTNHTPITFDQQAQVSQGHTSCRNKENRNTEVHDGGDLEPVKLACDRASSRPKPCASLENFRRILSVRRALFAFVGRKQTMVKDHIYPQKPLVRAFGSRAQVFSTPQARRRSSFPPP